MEQGVWRRERGIRKIAEIMNFPSPYSLLHALCSWAHLSFCILMDDLMALEIEIQYFRWNSRL
jgi:hypothetical protein